MYLAQEVPTLSPHAHDVCAKLFEYLDADKNGMLDPVEQKKAARLIHSMMMPKARFELVEFDSNSDGLISRDEWFDYMRAIVHASSEKDVLDAIKRSWGAPIEDNTAAN